MKNKLIVTLLGLVVAFGIASQYVYVHIGSDALILSIRPHIGWKYTPIAWHIFK